MTAPKSHARGRFGLYSHYGEADDGRRLVNTRLTITIKLNQPAKGIFSNFR